MNILFIRFSSLGDIVLQTPIISWFKMIYPESKITFLTSKEFRSLVDGHAHIDNCVYYERKRGLDDIRGLKALSYEIESKYKPDLIIDLHGTLRAKLIRLFCSSTLSLVIDKRSIERSILIRLKMNFLKRLSSNHSRVLEDFSFLFNHEFNREKLASFLDDQTHFISDRISSTPMSFTKEIPQKIDGDYIVISPVASFAPKRWSIENFKKLSKLILDNKKFADYKVVIVAGPSDKYCEVLNTIESDYPERFINLQGKTSLNETVEILAHAKLCISNDTGMAHISESFGRPVISLFGPTSESFGFKPHLEKSVILSQDLWCRPCSGTGKSKCFRSEQFCFTQILPEHVESQIGEILCT